jgi:hypothetical protein
MINTECICAFIEDAQRALGFVSTDKPHRSPLQALVAAGKSPGGKRRGRLRGGIAWEVHGGGCDFIFDDDRTVSLDIGPHGQPKFDAWRLARYWKSRGNPMKTEQAEACLRMATEVSIVDRGPEGWYTTPHLSRDTPSP